MAKVSVVVPVYNPGSRIDECIRSLLGQSLPAAEVDLIFVDDGSTDGTPARLDALAAEHANVRVEHIENSGWPGRPRNIGIGMARGEYVYFVDNDDWLGEQALERLYATARGDDADIVVGKVVGEGHYVPRRMFRRSVHGVRFESPELLGLLTPHKLFRRAFVDEHGIRFPEGRRRLEDHSFVVEAYFRAARISVLADYPCYHWAQHSETTNASIGRFDAEPYYESVREVLDLVDRNTEAGADRDALLMHWYRGKMLGRVGGRSWAARPDDFRRDLHAAVRLLADERFGDRLDERLAFNLRIRAHLLREGSYEDLLALARLEAGLQARIELRAVERTGSGVLRLRLTAELPGVRFVRRGERVLWEPPERLRAALADVSLDVTEELAAASAEAFLARLGDGTEYLLPSETAVALEPAGAHVRPVLDVTAELDPATAGGGGRLPAGEWVLRAEVTIAGFYDAPAARRHRLRAIVTSTASGRVRVSRATALREAAAHRLRR